MSMCYALNMIKTLKIKLSILTLLATVSVTALASILFTNSEDQGLVAKSQENSNEQCKNKSTSIQQDKDTYFASCSGFF